MNQIEEYINSIDEKRVESFNKLYQTVKTKIPTGFQEIMSYGMISFVVPLEIYPKGYLNRTEEPLPFVSIAVQKNHIALYHMGIMGNKEVLTWFEEEYAKQVSTKLNMGKSCIRFTNAKKIPYHLIGELMTKISLEEWVITYEKYMNKGSYNDEK
ncbi:MULTISPECIES: DUF1801 domain-containing protein [Vagococcus]|uniref:DUF1801 domain-containing protein n=1 Tax=Vagococcus fluvialis bH819 TaxID=1255619 RepID=A0A1X6WRE4_9ENTE|nr:MULTISPECIES: DUF1801 domain-containing protein [Vagococcus]SLM86829.1 DUF1801 domain-containing protein [Vagococcus fluvialis bH819]HCM88713.1 DUF1801 domain-containing protein [Vagococcus sp.]